MKQSTMQSMQMPSFWVGFLIFALAITNFSCNNTKQKAPPGEAGMAAATIPETLPWSERMAKSVMKRNREPWMIDFRDSPKWNYTQGLVLMSILRVWEKTNDPAYFDYVKKFGETLVNEQGEIQGDYDIANFNIDHINPGKILFSLYKETGDERYKVAMQTLRQQLQWQPRTTDGGFWHKLRYPWQMWLDGLYMGAPYYAAYAVQFDEPEAFDDIARQLILMEKHARDAKTGLLYHGWDESRVQRWSNDETGLSPCFWGRAIGWYAMALVDVLDHFPKDHPQRTEIIALLNRTAEGIAKYQDGQSGLWYQVMDQGTREGNYLEATASCMFVYALAKGSGKGYLSETFMEVAEKGYDGILRDFIEVTDNGEVHIHKCCSVAGLGGDPYRDGSYEYYINEPVRSNDPKATGPFILASLEFEKMGYISKQ